MGKVKTKKRIKNDLDDSMQIDAEQNIEYSMKVLDRMDFWINSCDSKLAILVGIYSIVLTICLTTDVIKQVRLFLIQILENPIKADVICFLITMAIAVILYGISFTCTYLACIARVDIKKYEQDMLTKKSLIFFGSIAKKKFNEYRQEFITSKHDERVNDILSQIYINSIIAEAKHKYYNKSLRFFSLATMLTVVLIIWGIIGF